MQEKTDIFLWANNTDAHKRDLEVELFLFNKNFTPYSTDWDSNLGVQLKPLFLYDLINFVNLGAGTGLPVRHLNDDKGDKFQVLHIDLSDVGRADTLIHIIENERSDILQFNAEEHDMKRVKGVVARFTHPTDKSIKFYAVKMISQTSIVSGGTSWSLNDGKFLPMVTDASIKMPADNQVLIVDGEIFIFNTGKFEKLFSHNAAKIKAMQEKGAVIDKHYKLSFPDFINEISFACIKATTINKLLAVDTENLMTQDQVIDTADEMQIELMVDDAGAIIIMDDADAGTFLDIINDNYVKGMTGNSYLAKKKQALDVAEEK
jgi:hypothetical protein